MKAKLLETIENNNAKREHYEIGNYKVELIYQDGKLDKDYVIIRENRDMRLPEIFFGRRFGQREYKFKIQTSSYGTLNPNEIQEVIAGYQEALEVVEVLKELIK